MRIAATLQQAVARHKAGQLQEAERLYRAILRVAPTQADANHNLGVLALQTGNPKAGFPYFQNALETNPRQEQYWLSYIDALMRAGDLAAARDVLHRGKAYLSHRSRARLEDALQARGKADQTEIHAVITRFNASDYSETEKQCRRLVEKYPTDLFGWKALASVLAKTGQSEAAIPILENGLTLSPDNPELLNVLGKALKDLGRFDEAIAKYERALAKKPDYAEAYNNLGVLFRQIGRHEKAADNFKTALQYNPNCFEAYYNIACIEKTNGNFDEAIDNFSKSIQLNKNFYAAYNDLANTYQEIGRHEEAISLYQQIISKNPGRCEIYNNMGNAYQNLGRPQESLALYAKALAMNPAFEEAYNNMVNALYTLRKYDEAIAIMKKSFGVNRNSYRSYANLGNIYQKIGRYDESIAMYYRALKINNNQPYIHNNLGVALRNAGKIAMAVSHYEKALALDKNYAECMSNYLFAQNLIPQKQQELFKKYRAFSQKFESTVKKTNDPCDSGQDDNKILRIGYVSGDFCDHPVSYFMKGIFANHDKENFEIYAYPTSLHYDETSAYIKSNVSHWVPLFGLSDAAAATRIRSDGIDILVDLSGHTEGNRLLVFARKPAPIQITWLGFLNTTGLDAIDYILCNRWMVPKSDTPFCAEQPWYFDGPSSCFTNEALERNIGSGPLPALKNKFVTFGCFNKYCKINKEVIACWIRILKRMPESRLFCISPIFENAGITNEFVQMFKSASIDQTRLLLKKSCPIHKFLESYNAVDISLDTFPYNGGTITCHSLSMGVPVLSKKGDSIISHVGESFLHPMGLDDWIARDAEDYVSKAVYWGNQLKELSILRRDLPERFKKIYADASGFTQRLETAYRHMWKIWCNKSSCSCPSSLVPRKK